MNRVLKAIIIIFLMSFLLPEAWGQLYQYTDKNGNVVFTDNSVPGVTTKEKQLKADGVYWSNRREADYPSYKDSGEINSSLPLENKRNKDYSSVTVDCCYVHGRLVRIL